MKLKSLYPNAYCDSAYNINFEKYRRLGYAAVIFDTDNTLVPQNSPCSGEVAELIGLLSKEGFKTGIISNNEKERVEPFAKCAGCEFVFHAKKPNKDGFILLCEKLGVEPARAIMVGDQIFTDILGARRAGIFCILVKPLDLSSDTRFIKVKRVLERAVLRAYVKEKQALGASAAID